MKYPFTYTVQGYNYEEKHYYLENGIGICKSFADAADILEKRFGSELIAIKHIELYEDDTVITFPAIVSLYPFYYFFTINNFAMIFTNYCY